MTDSITEAIDRLDQMDREVTDWEANFLDSLKRRGCHSPKQQTILTQMVEKYLQDLSLAAEIRGQQPLFR